MVKLGTCCAFFVYVAVALIAAIIAPPPPFVDVRSGDGTELTWQRDDGGTPSAMGAMAEAVMVVIVAVGAI